MYDIKEIKSKITVPDYLRRIGVYVDVGKRYVSPLRQTADNPTAFCVKSEDFWYDFVAARGGDVVDLAAEISHNHDKGAAIRELAEITGVSPNGSDLSYQWRQYTEEMNNRTAFYHEKLTAEDYEYLASRGFTKADAERLKIGRVTDGHLKGRLFLPYFKNGYVCYYATRAMPGGAYPDSKYRKQHHDEYCQHIPWGLQTLDRRGSTLVISEGYFDAASWEKEGYPVLSPITGNFSGEQWPEVIAACRMFERVLIIFDNDAVSHAGETFTERTAQKLFKHRIPFVVGNTPPGVKDVNDYYAAGGSLQKLVDEAQDGMKYMVSRYSDAVELKKFIMSVSRHMDPTAIASALFTPSMEAKFPKEVLKSIMKAAETAPSESKIVEEIMKNHDLLFVEGDGFYEWNGVIWDKKSDYTIEKYIGDAYGKNFQTAQRKAQARKNLCSECLADVSFNKSNVMTFQNGTLELNTGAFRPQNRADYCSFALGYSYDANARCPRWERFIDECTNDDPKRKDVLQCIMGYVMLPDCRYQKIFMLMGKGGNGKSVYLDIMKNLFGEKSCSNITPTQMSDNFQRIFLKDSLVNYATEIKGDVSSSMDWLKKISCGEEINGSYKGKDNIRFSTRSKLIFACNAIPSASVVEGLDRRLHFIDFPCSFVPFPDKDDPLQRQADTELIPKLNEELPGILNWAYNGYKLLNTVKYFTETDEQTEYMKQFAQASNPVAVFCEDYEEEFRGVIRREAIYAEYVSWCGRTGHKQLANTKFFPAFRSAMGAKIIREVTKRFDNSLKRGFEFKTPPRGATVFDCYN